MARFALALAALTFVFAPLLLAQDADSEAKYTATITKRADDIVAKLELDDAAKAARVRDRIVTQYRSLRDFHDNNEATIKALKKENTSESTAKLDTTLLPLRELHRRYLSDLEQDLTSEQIDAVKNGMTFNVLNVTYTAYLDKIPSLTDEQKQYIKSQLTDARELAMDEGSSDAKHAVFGKFKGRINNYLSQAGYDLRAEEKAWQQRLKERRERETAATQKSN